MTAKELRQAAKETLEHLPPEQLKNPQARKLLAALARNTTDELLSRKAKECLQRLGGG